METHGEFAGSDIQTGRRPAELAGRVEILAQRIALLRGADKLVMTMHFRHGASFRQIARLMRANEATVARRIRRLSAVLLDGPYIKCLRSRDKLSRPQLRIARDYFLRGLSVRQVAAGRRSSVYAVCKTLRAIKRTINAD